MQNISKIDRKDSVARTPAANKAVVRQAGGTPAETFVVICKCVARPSVCKNICKNIEN